MSAQPSLELSIAVEGKIISSNFEAFREYATAQIEAINFDLKTDEDFEQAAEDVKLLKKFEETLTVKKKEFLEQMDEVNRLFEGVDRVNDLSRATRLELDKRVRDQKNAVKEGIIRDGIAALAVKNREFERRIGEAIKGKSSLVKMQEAVLKAVETINAIIQKNRELYRKAESEHGNAVAYGEDAFVCLTIAEAIIEMERRIERHKAALKEAELKAERDRLQREALQMKRAAEAKKASEIEQVEQPAEPVKQVEETRLLDSRPFVPHEEDLPRETELTETEEMEAFLNILKSAFSPVKLARQKLKHRRNIDRAEAFAEALVIAWVALNEEVAP